MTSLNHMWKSRKRVRVQATARWVAAVAVLLGLVGVTAALGLRQRPENPVTQNPIDWDGHHWSTFSSAEKEAFVGGFLAGAAAAQAYEVLEGEPTFDGEALEEQVRRLRAERMLVFPYAPNLYHARLHDYLFYVNNRERPLYEAMAELNFEIRGARP